MMTPERTLQVRGCAHALDDYHSGRKPTWVSHEAAWRAMPEDYKQAYVDEWTRCDQATPRNSPKRVDD